MGSDRSPGRGSRTWLRALLLSALAVAPAGAVDGVLEISHDAALAGGVTPGDTPGYPVTLDGPGSYRLTSDLVLPSTSNVRDIEVLAGPTTIDLNGFAVRGPASCSGLPVSCSGSQASIGIEVSSDEPVRIRNGTILRTFVAVSIPISTSDHRSLDLRDLVITENEGTGLVFSGYGQSTVRGCRIDRNQLNGINVPVQHTIHVSDTTFRSNGLLALNSSGSASLVQNSHFLDNQTGIYSFLIVPSPALAYQGNMFAGNATDVVGGTPVGDNLCSGGSCP